MVIMLWKERRSFLALLKSFNGSRCNILHRLYSQQEGKVRVRFAPSPTGYLHLGGLRTALYNYLFAKSNNGDFILRIEDTDQTRLVPDSLQNLEEMLEWTELSPDEGPSAGGNYAPYKQSERLEVYQENVKTLLENGSCYKCFCTPQRLELLRKNAIRNKETPRYDNKCRTLSETQVKENLNDGVPFVIRFKMKSRAKPFNDLIVGKTLYDVGSIEGDPVMMKRDGFPTYHFASVVDDHLMKITHVLRGQEWQMSTNKHLLLYEAFGWNPPKFAHLPLVLNKDGRTKLSKRFGNNTYVSHFQESGIYPEALLNFLTFCGSGFEDNHEILTLPEMVDKFSIDKVLNHSAVLDLELLPGVNQAHLIRRFQDQDLQEKLITELKVAVENQYEIKFSDRDFLYRILDLRKHHISNIKELITSEYSYLWVKPDVEPEKIRAITPYAETTIKCVIGYLATIENKSLLSEDLKKDLKETYQQVSGVSWPAFMKVIRMCLSATMEGPSVADMITMLGPSEVLQRMRRAQEILEEG